MLKVKWSIINVIMFISLSGCATPSKTHTETIYEPIFPPQALTRECYPKRPDSASLGDIIIIQQAAINQCNLQLESIRNWRKAESENL